MMLNRVEKNILNVFKWKWYEKFLIARDKGTKRGNKYTWVRVRVIKWVEILN